MTKIAQLKSSYGGPIGRCDASNNRMDTIYARGRRQSYDNIKRSSRMTWIQNTKAKCKDLKRPLFKY